MKKLISLTLMGLLSHSIHLTAAQATNDSYTDFLTEKALVEWQINLLQKKFETITVQEQDFEKQALLIDRNDYMFKTVQKVSKKLHGIAHENIQMLYLQRALLRESLKALRTYPYAALLEDTNQSEKYSFFWYNKLRKVCRE